MGYEDTLRSLKVKNNLYVGGSISGQVPGTNWFVDSSITASGSGTSWSGAFKTLKEAVAVAVSKDTIYLAPGTHTGPATGAAVTISASNITLTGVGPQGSVIVGYEYNPLAVGTIATGALIVTGKNVEVNNIDFSGGNGSVYGVLVKGDSFRSYDCKFEMENDVGIALQFLPTAVSGTTASLAIIDNCLFDWCETGVSFESVTSACTEDHIRNCTFENCSVNCINERVADSVRAIEINNCIFQDVENGTAPTKYIELSNANNTGIVTNCTFPVATNGGKVLMSAAIHCIGNKFTTGFNTAQPT